MYRKVNIEKKEFFNNKIIKKTRSALI